MRKFIVVLILSCILFTCFSKQADSFQCESSVEKISTNAVLEVSSENVREVLVDAYRLRPDMRFLLAFAEVHHFLSGEQKEKVLAEYKDGQWKICYQNKEIGYLPEFPDFKDSINLLSNYIKLVHKQYPLRLSPSSSNKTYAEIDKEINKFLSPHLSSTLHKIDYLWNKGERNSALLYYAARSLVLLVLQRLDNLETTDTMQAKALAILAITKSLTNYNIAREESLLAYSMGYANHSVDISNKLKESDAIRLYVTHDDQRLMKIAMKKDSTVESHYLFLLRLAEGEDIDSFISWIKIHFSNTWLTLPLFNAILKLDKFSLNPIFSEALPRFILLSLSQEVGIIPELVEHYKDAQRKSYSDEELKSIANTIISIFTAKQSNLVDNFESGLNILEQRYRGPFLDPQTYKAYYMGYFFSSLYVLGLHYLDSLSSIDATNKFINTLGNADRGLAADFKQWYRNLAKSKEGKADISLLVNDMITLTNFGTAPVMRTFEEQKKYHVFADPKLISTAKYLVKRFDSRIEHRLYLANLLYTDLLDLRLAERLYGSILVSTPIRSQYLRIWHANFTGNYKLLQQLLHTPAVVFEVSVKILDYLENNKILEDKVIQSEYRLLINEAPYHWYVRFQYSEYLGRKGKYPEARKVIEDWLDRDVRTGGLEHIAAVVKVAQMYYKEGLYKEGLDAIKPVIGSWKADALETAAVLLDKLGEREDAEKMAYTVVSRYPDSLRSRVLLAELYWRHGKYNDAADTLKSSLHNLSIKDWQWTIAPKFAEAFKEKSKEDTFAAFSSLIKKGFGHYELLRISFPIAKAGKNDIAFEMAASLQGKGIGNLEFILHSYRYLKAWKGKQTALDWLRQKIPFQMLNSSSMAIYQHGEYDLLWELIRNPEQGEYADFVYLMRAAASLKLGKNNDPHYPKLIEYYKNKPKGHYNEIGSFLIGLTMERDILTLAKDPKKLCEIAYYAGIKAISEERYNDASDWFRTVIETGLINNDEYRWAFDILYKWQSSGKNLAQI